jgi:hypothetical protein
MNIQINEEYRITSDQHNVILNKKMEKKEGSTKTEDTYRQIAFYPNLQQACVGILHKSINLSEDTISSLEALVELIDDVEENIISTIENMEGK